MRIAGNNMGNMSKKEVRFFFNSVISELGIDLKLEFTPTAPSIYLGDKILICTQDLNDYKWAVKERVLHEIAHHFEKGKRTHGKNYYRAYVKLLGEFMVGFNEQAS
ncbi:hypothetical protein LCGC14_1330840 [marine sediment metagenome]|uniref:IrrE N-terminal-like domain-containing protein n=1 Tax=marine sediment metagenome TaxID=412755 RepID=A0A0F9NJ52_9ZZZZ